MSSRLLFHLAATHRRSFRLFKNVQFAFKRSSATTAPIKTPLRKIIFFF
jgi:hypothetical protein